MYTRGYPRRDLTEVRLADRDGANDHVLLFLAGHQVYEAGATWSPDNGVVAVPIHIIGKESRFVLYAISLSGKHAKELYSSQGFIGRPLWLDSGKGLLVTVEDVSTHRGQLWTLSYPDGEARRFTNNLSDYSEQGWQRTADTPRTGWFGRDGDRGRRRGRRVLRRLFAAGDIRHASVKRFSSVGEGAMAVVFVHRYLSAG